MRRIVSALCAIALLPGLALPQSRRFGAGIVVGSPTGITAKLWLGRRTAVDAALSVSSKDDLSIHVDHLWHDFNAFPRPEEGQLPLYYGIGGAVTSGGRVSVRPVIGVEYLFAGYPFDIFIELAPRLQIAPDTDLVLTGALGARYFFGG